METNAAIGIRAFRAILEVAFYRTTDSCQLASYLVMPSCLQIDFQERVVLTFHKRLIGQHCQLSILIPPLWGGFGRG